MIRQFFLILTFLFACAEAYADIYYWVDSKGVKHFSNISTSESNIEVIKEKKTLTSYFPEEINGTGSFEVLKVYDGDSVKVKGYNLIFKVRLVGIDAPETGGGFYKGQPFSLKAKKFLEKRIRGKKVTLKSYGLGGYNRQLAEIFINNTNINLEILKAGLAEIYKGKPAKGLNIKRYYQAQSLAKKKEIGIWSLNPRKYKSPKKWRKEHPRK